jgi:hypothetical protein
MVEGARLAEGRVVTILSRQDPLPAAPSAKDEDELLAAMAEIQSGEFISADELFESLRRLV